MGTSAHLHYDIHPSPVSPGVGGYNHPELSTHDALDIYLDWELEDGIWTVGLVDVAEVVAGI